MGCAHACQTWNYSAGAAHAGSRPAPCLQREPARLAASPGLGGAESCVWPQDVLFWPASFRWDYHILDTLRAVWSYTRVCQPPRGLFKAKPSHHTKRSGFIPPSWSRAWTLGEPGRLACVCPVTSVVADSLQPYGPQPARLLGPWDSPDVNTGVCCHTLL